MNKYLKLISNLTLLLSCVVTQSFAANTATNTATNAPITIASDIYPVQQIANAISGQKTSLVSESYLSPHRYQLTPKKAELIKQVDLFIWIGKPLMSQINQMVINRKGNTLTLIDITGLNLLTGDDGDDDHADEHTDNHADHETNRSNTNHADEQHGARGTGDAKYSNIDEHIWLSTSNAKIIAKAIADRLITLDSANKDKYLANLANFNQQLDKVKIDIAKLLLPLKNRPFYVFHDAYNYFENEFAIKSSGVIKISPNQDVRAKHLVEIKYEIKKQVAAQQVVCLFSEPQFNSKIAKQLADDTGAKLGILDPIGYSQNADLDYPMILLAMAKSLNNCLLNKNS